MDTTGATDVTTALDAFLRGPGGVLCLVPGGIYRIDGGEHLSSRTNVTIEGQGATLRRTTRGTAPILLVDGGGSGVTVRNVTVQGANPNPGKWDRNFEHEHCLAIGGVQHVVIDKLTCLNVGGDGLYLGGGANQWADDVTVTHSTFDGIGRMCVALTDGISHLLVQGNTFRRCAYYTWDVEPNGVQVGGRLAGAEHFTFTGNAIGPGPFGTYPADKTQADGYAFVTTAASGGGACSDGTVTGNTVTDPNPLYSMFRYHLFLACSPMVISGNTNQVLH